jgi:PAS domain S-box-containing protein
MTKEPRPHYAFWFAIIGFILGLIFVALATFIALISLQQMGEIEAISLENAIALHFSNQPLIWLIDTVPFLAAFLMAIVGNRQNNLVKTRYQYGRAIQQREAEIRHLNAVLAKQDEAHQQLDEVIGRGKRDWEATFDAVEDMIIITDISGKILRCNRATSHVFRLNFESIIGQPIENLFFGSLTETNPRLPSQKTEMQFPKLDGWYEVSSNTTKLEEERTATIYVVRNITDRKQASLDLSRQKEFYESLVHNSPFAIATLSLDQRIVATNPAFERIFGYSQQEVIGHDLDQLISPQDLIDETQELTEAVKRGDVVHKLTRRLHKNGSQVEVEVYGIPVVLWGKQIGILALYHDVSELVRLEPEPPVAAMYEEYTAPAEEIIEAKVVSAEEAAEAKFDEVEIDQEIAQESIAKLANKPMIEIEGIGPAYSEKLANVGIETVDQYLMAAADRKGRKDLAEKSGISPKLILDWAHRADLMRVPGIGEEFSDLVAQAGVDTVNELKFRNPEHLHNTLAEINEQKNLVRRLPSEIEVAKWIDSAKKLPVMLSY